MKTSFPVGPVLVVVSIGLVSFLALRGPLGVPVNDVTNGPVPGVLPLPPAVEDPSPQEVAEAEEVTERRMESRNADDRIAQQFWPDASVNLTGGRLGTQRVPFTQDIGDVGQVLFDNVSYTLFMLVREPDGLRSVWQMKENRKPERVFTVSAGEGDLALFSTPDGAIYVQHDKPCRLYRTQDAFKTWQEVSTKACMFWNIATDGTNVYGALHNWNEPIIWRSPDRGFSWEPWVDFREVFPEDAVTYREGDDRLRLRHLHDIFWDEHNSCLVVGTGDVARYALRSCDDGKSWQKVWSEGFTAHLPIEGGRFLLGPDQLHNHGIGLYDPKLGTTREVWNPRPYGYAGYVYSMANADGTYYVATHTEANEAADIVPVFGVIVSPDGVQWYKFLEWGPLGNHARTDVWLASAPGLIYASVNGALYAFRPLDDAWFADKTPFGTGASASTP